jgi:anthranilate phosphoribosyltransferase
MEAVLDPATPHAQSAALLTALRMKGETVDEIAAAAEVMRRNSPKIQVDSDAVVLDRDEINVDEETVTKTCSLDGAETRTFNISTATALTAAGGGLQVAKSGARYESTFCGSADVVAALGVNLDLTLTEVERCIKRIGLGFLYASLFHNSLIPAVRVREEIGLRTIFNLIGPLSNPAGAVRQVLGVYLPERTELMCRVLMKLGCREAMVVCGQDTFDELSTTGPTRVARLTNGEITTYDLQPEDAGLKRASAQDISGGGREANAKIIRAILEGEKGPRRDVTLLNAAAAFMVGGRASDFKEGVALAEEAIDSGRAKKVLDDLVEFTGKCGVYQHKDVS